MRLSRFSFPMRGMACAFVLAVPAAKAQPMLLVDTAFVHGAQAASRPEAALPLRASVPEDWTSPTAYASGTAHFRLEILHKPTGAAIRYQPCLERAATRACAASQLLSDSGATRAEYAWSQALSQWTPAGASWSARPDRLVLVLQDAYGRPIVPAAPGGPAPSWVGQPFTALYYPMSVRFSAAVVPPGASFPGWSGIIPVTVAYGRPMARGTGPGLVRSAGGGLSARTAGGTRDLRGRLAADRGR